MKENPVEEENDFNLGTEVKKAFLSIPRQFLSVFISEESAADISEDGNNFERSIFSLLRKHFNKHSAYAFMLFVLIYFPCVAALAVAIKELKIFYGSLLPIYLTFLAWITATLYYQIAYAHDLKWILIPSLMLTGLYGALKIIGRREKV